MGTTTRGKPFRLLIAVGLVGILAGCSGDTDELATLNLFAPMGGTTTYLMDMDENFVHQWVSTKRPAMGVYLLENGNLLRGRNNAPTTPYPAGSSAGLDEYDWDGNVVWTIDLATMGIRAHHDVEPLANGNILVVAWDEFTQAELIQLGRDPAAAHEDGILLDAVYEIAPTGQEGGDVVWEWHSADHLIQDFDETKDNYGVVEDHPELLDLNHHSTTPAGMPRWDYTHINAVDYNADLDQIVLTIHGFGEMVIIDHGTTSAQAAGHTGGLRGKGGDLLYRWGNPQAYRAGGEEDQVLFRPHDGRWIPAGRPGAGNLLVFNNGDQVDVPVAPESSVVEIVPPVQPDGTYSMTGGRFDPAAPVWTYTREPIGSFFSPGLSGAQRLPDGNTLICSGEQGWFLEVTPAGDTVWEYRNLLPNPNKTNVYRVERLQLRQSQLENGP